MNKILSMLHRFQKVEQLESDLQQAKKEIQELRFRAKEQETRSNAEMSILNDAIDQLNIRFEPEYFTSKNVKLTLRWLIFFCVVAYGTFLLT